MPNKPREGLTPVMVKLAPELAARLDAFISDRLTEHPGQTHNRATVIREALEAFLPREPKPGVKKTLKPKR